MATMSASINNIIAEPFLDDLSERKRIFQQLHDAAQIGDVTAVKCVFETYTQLPIDIARRGNTTLHTALCHNQEGVLIDYLITHQLNELSGVTAIMIMPGYDFKFIKGLITNFHQPGSTLIVLVSAFIGDDWKKVYNTALDQNYRFLSYGDSSILIPKK